LAVRDGNLCSKTGNMSWLTRVTVLAVTVL